MNAKMLIIIGPTAVGKSSVIARALADYPQLCDIITFTTRDMRAGESPGNPYHHVNEAKFKELIAKDFFVEWALVHGCMYGTPKDQIEAAGKNNKICVMDVDVQGAKKILERYPQAVTLFLLPPSIDALRQRFRGRGVASEADLNRRLESAQREIAQAHDFQHVLVNDEFSATYAEVRKIIEKLVKNQ